MAEKQMATSAIQGKFSAEGLAAMATGVDARVKMAQALAEGDTGDRKSIENMFDVLNKNAQDEGEAEAILSKTFYEVTGLGRKNLEEKKEAVDMFSLFESMPVAEVVAEEVTTKAEKTADNSAFDPWAFMFGEPVVHTAPTPKKSTKKASAKKEASQISLFDLDDLSSFFCA